MSGPWVLGVSYSHNGAACLLRGDQLVVAIQEERLTGQKRARIDHYQDSLAVAYCLAHVGIGIRDLSVLVACHFSTASPPAATLRPHEPPPPHFIAIPHHLGHAHAVVAGSGWRDSAVLIVDGQGGEVAHLPPAELAQLRRGVVPGLVREAEVISIYRADGDGLTLREKHTGDWIPSARAMTGTRPPRSLQPFGSLGGMYAAASALIFGDWMEAGKVMGLAPYGRATTPVEDFFTIDDDCFHYSDRVCGQHVGLEPWPHNRDRFADLAASVQAALEHGVLYLARRARELTGAKRLCYAGGVALNSVANERVWREAGFDDVYVMPAAEDSGAAIGAAYYGLRTLGPRPPPRRRATDAVGRSYAASEVDAAIARVPWLHSAPADLDEIVSSLCDGQIVGWFEGGSELGPRALGQRSILCDARRADGKAVLNDRVKHRESFRPFAPAILRDEMASWFETDADSPYMLRVIRFRDEVRERVPAVVHVDGTGRVQTLTAANGRLHELVQRFFQRTGVPILLNTSFNVAGEPIVETPEDALWCLLATGLDAVAFDGTLVRKPAARSLLELHPRLRSRQVRVATPIVDGSLDLALRSDAEVALVTDTPHGELVVRVRVDDVALLALCDGTRDGRRIVDELARTSRAPLDEEHVARRLYHLRRGHVISLHEAP